MASGQAHIASALVKLLVRRRLARVTDPRQIRRLVGRTRRFVRPGTTFEPASLGGVDGEWVRSATEARARLFYIHGGGFVACSPRTHRPITAALARRGFEVFAANYRLAPEHPFPAANDDVLAAWRALRQQSEGPLVLAGDSAGGTLALGLMIALRDGAEPLPAAAALFSPATDLTAASRSYRQNIGRDAMFGPAILAQFRKAYLGHADPHDPRISPLFAPLCGLPPILIHVGERELLRDDSLRFAEQARQAGVRCEVKVWPVVPHVWQLAEQFIPEARRSLDDAARFLHAAADASPEQRRSGSNP